MAIIKNTVNGLLNVNGATGPGATGGTVFNVEGTQGVLFKVIDGLTGSLMSVNNISGLPVLEVFSDNRIVMGAFGDPAMTVSGSSVSIRRRIELTADPSATTQSTAVIRNTTTNSGIAIVPNGTGAITASVPDGGTGGGNVRGNYAVDLQMLRTANDQIASGLYSFNGGYGSISSGQNSFSFGTISGGNSNTASGTGAVSIGNGNRALSTGSVAFGTQSFSNALGSVAIGLQSNSTSNYSTVSGGQSNVASTNTHATVVGGQSNTSSGQHSVSGGQGNTASGLKAVAFGESNTNTSSYSFGIGYRTSGYLYGQFQAGSGYFASNGDAQQSLLTARREAAITTAGTMALSLDGTGSTNLIIPAGNNRVWNVTVKWASVVTSISGTATGVSVGNVISGTTELTFKRVGGTSSLVGITRNVSTYDTSMSSASMSYSAGGSGELALLFTGPTFAGGGTLTVRSVAKVELTEIAW
jgi:trimeric autotransporter adhesin